MSIKPTNDPNRLKSICEALNEINKNVTVVLPLHPRTKNYLQANNIPLQAHLIDPVGYFDMLQLLHHCELVLTDSGGLQKEAYFFSKYCITLQGLTAIPFSGITNWPNTRRCRSTHRFTEVVMLPKKLQRHCDSIRR
jgi:UDP-N-acetylglucosamine 2-epimerase